MSIIAISEHKSLGNLFGETVTKNVKNKGNLKGFTFLPLMVLNLFVFKKNDHTNSPLLTLNKESFKVSFSKHSKF